MVSLRVKVVILKHSAMDFRRVMDNHPAYRLKPRPFALEADGRPGIVFRPDIVTTLC